MFSGYDNLTVEERLVLLSISWIMVQQNEETWILTGESIRITGLSRERFFDVCFGLKQEGLINMEPHPGSNAQMRLSFEGDARKLKLQVLPEAKVIIRPEEIA